MCCWHLCGSGCVVGLVRSLVIAALVTDFGCRSDLSLGPERGPSHVCSQWTPGAGGLCTATTTRIRARGKRGESTSCFSCLGSFFFSFKFSQSSPVFGTWAETFSTFWWWTFDGVICCLLSEWCIFLGDGAGGTDYVGGSYHWFTG